MSTDNEKRSSKQQMNTDDNTRQGVGGRHAHIDLPAQGGGYLDVYHQTELARQGDQKKSRDPRIDELHEMGLSAIWISVAELIGYESFIRMWRYLDASLNEPPYVGDTSKRLRIPQFGKYARYQRNQAIKAFAGPPHCLSFVEIQKLVKSELGESVSHTTVRRIVNP